MGPRALSIGVLSFLGFLSAAAAGTYHQPGFSFLTSESNNYSPLTNYYVQQQPQQQQQQSAAPVVRKHRGVGYSHTHTYVDASPIYVNKAPLYYPESAVFSEPLPIVPLPQLPSQFLTLTSANIGDYGGSENEVPKGKKSGKKGRRGKSGMSTTTPAPADDEVEEEEDAQETEADSQGGYDSPSTKQRQQSSRGTTGQREGSVAGEQGEGGYPSSFDANANMNTGSGSNNVNNQGSQGRKSRTKSNKNRGNSQEEDEDSLAVGEIEGDDEEEIMMTGDDAQDDEENARDNAAELDQADDEEDDEEEPPKRSKNAKSKSGGKKSGKGKGRSRGGSSGEDEETALKAALDEEAQRIGTIYLPTFGNNVLNTVFPAYSQNALLRSLESQVGMGNQGYPESGMDISAISIAADDDKKKKRKSKKRTSARKNRPASSRGRSSSRRSKNRQASSVRAQEPNNQNQGGYPNSQQQQTEGNQGGYPNPSQQQSQGNQGQQSPQYGPPQFTPGNPSGEYGAPSFQQGGSRNSGINPPPPSGNAGGYQTINNELRGRPRTSDFPSNSQFTSRQSPLQEYGAPSGGGSQRVSLIEPRQMSQATVVQETGNAFQSVPDSNNPVTAELIRTVQAILQRYPN